MNLALRAQLTLVLAVAAAGPIPLWLHRSIAHPVCCSEHSANSVQTCKTDQVSHSHPHECDSHPNETAPDSIGLVANGLAGTHDCSVCFHLSQSSSSVAHSIAPVNCEHIFQWICGSISAECCRLEGQPLSRGPPAFA